MSKATGTHAARIAELEESKLAKNKDWQLAQLDHAIAHCEQLLRSPELDDEQRAVVVNQLAVFHELREEKSREGHD